MRVLVAGIGNIFLGDDGFGVEVAHRLAERSWPPEVCVRDFGIRGVHLAYELSGGGYDAAVLVDAIGRGGVPGTVYAIVPEVGRLEAPADAHDLQPHNVLAMAKTLGGLPPRLLVAGCEPESLEERIGLSAPVLAAVDNAAAMVCEWIEKETGHVSGNTRTDRAVASGNRSGDG